MRIERVAIVCAGLCVTMGLGLAVQVHAARLDPFLPHVPVPIRMLDDMGHGDAASSNAELLLSLTESALLLALYRLLRGKHATRPVVIVLGVAFVVLASLAVASPVANSSDLYGYVGFALQPATAYAPVTVPFTGDHAVIDTIFGNPRPAAWYGPLWIGFTHVLLLPFGSLVAQLAALRALEVAALATCIVLMHRTGTSLGVLAVLAVNPAVFDVWVVDGHNDLFGVALIVAAGAAQRRPALRIALVASAGLVKLPLVVIGAIVFGDEALVVRRIAYACASVVVALALSYAFGGASYLTHLLAASETRHTQPEATLHVVCAFTAAVVLGAGLVGLRRSIGAAWIWRAMAAFPAPWYAVWGLPYALASGAAATLLVAEPLDAYFFSWNYASTFPESVAKFFALVGPVSYALAVRFRSERSAVPSHANALHEGAR
jgi:hypothetical protein